MPPVERPTINRSPLSRLQHFMNFNGKPLDAVEGLKIRGGKAVFHSQSVTAIRNLTAQERIEQSVGVTPACVVTLEGREVIVQVVTSNLLGIIKRNFIRVDEFRVVEALSMQSIVKRNDSQGEEDGHPTAANPRRMRFVYDLPDPGISKPVQR